MSSDASRRVDDRVKVLLENCAQSRHRSFFLLVGDKGKDQIVNLHAMVSKAQHKAKVSMLWCYKKELSFGGASKHKRAAQFKKEVDRGMTTAETNSAFEVFLSQTKIRFCYYKDTHKVLGQTFGMCVLQDFEALTPNLLARTMETVEGGGCVVLLIRTLKSLKQLYTLTMDVHNRYRTALNQDVVPRFNERFLLSLSGCKSFLCLSDKLEVLPFTSGTRAKLAPVAKDIFTEEEKKLKVLQQELKGNDIVGPLIQTCFTLQQATSVLTMMEAITEKSLATTATVTAGRGRGKSAALGLAAAGAVTQGYSNIFVTSPSPENVQTLFEFVAKGLEGMGYVEREHFEIVQADNPELGTAVIRINVFKGHRQTVQYLLPTDAQKFAQAELLIIDEAAAIPLPLVKSLMGPYLIFLSSTITGYEGTGRSLSLKLFSDLKKQSVSAAATGAAGAGGATAKTSRSLKEITLEQPIRYGSNDPVESWLNRVLCLDAQLGAQVPPPVHPDQLELFYVNRDTLFSYHNVAEELLQRIVALYVSSHYKNQPNDLQLLSDAPSHHLFVLLDSQAVSGGGVPNVYAVIQVAQEGVIASEKLEQDLSKGVRPSGDLIPYTLSQHFQESAFAELSGMRVVRIAVLPDYTRKQYGTRALQLLTEYYQGGMCSLADDDDMDASATAAAADDDDGSFSIQPRKNLPHLLHRLTDRKPETCHYLGVGYGLTTELFNYWFKNGFQPVYLRQGKNDLTGEHTMIMLKELAAGGDAAGIKQAATWVGKFKADFLRRFIRLLPVSFKSVPLVTALSVASDPKAQKNVRIDDATGTVFVNNVPQLTEAQLLRELTPHDLQRLSAFTRQMVDRSVVLDLIPILASLYFTGRIFHLPSGGPGVQLPVPQAAVLLGIGLQGITFDDVLVQAEFSATKANQLSSLLDKALHRIVSYFDIVRTADADAKPAADALAAAADGGDVKAVVSLPRKAKRKANEAGVGAEDKVAEQEPAAKPKKKLKKKKIAA